MKFFGLLVLSLFLYLQAPVHACENIIVIDNGKMIAGACRENFALPLIEPELIDPVKFKQFEMYVSKKIEQPPVNAKISVNGMIIPEKKGWKLNKHIFAEQFYRSFYSKDTNVIEAAKIAVYPRVDSELLSQIGIKRIGQYVTYYRTTKKARANNISRAAEAIDNYVIFPGEIFSFNKVVGKRTEARGYMKAPEIVKGNLIEGVGGGICQVSSTLFNAVDSSGMKILERYSHSKTVPYVPPGRDATVSWYGPDFVFINNYNQPVLIKAMAANGRLTVILYSSEAIDHSPRHVPNITKDEALKS